MSTFSTNPVGRGLTHCAASLICRSGPGRDEMADRVIDLSHDLDPTTPVYPEYPPVEIRVLESTRYSIPGGRRALNSSRVSVGIHCGTHMDAPFHFFEDGATIDQIELGHCVGKAQLIHIDVPADGKIERGHLTSYRDLIVRC